ncbi:MAG TPA: ATP-binding protein, partial [Polyangiaceae bacterium]|nr:ATP-binding protein [Polyangiaceae bacterium]
VDPTRIAQVVANLLTNAARHGRQGGHVWLSTHIADKTAVIHVRDDGPGMSAELLERVFELFAQGSDAGSRPGLGVGLALARMLVELHEGTVQASSAGPGLGSEFVVVLPLGASAAAPPANDGMPTPAGPPTSRRRVLVVDDNVDAAEVLAALLELRGHEVAIAHDGVQALSLVESARPAVVLLDIEMPGMNGYEVARAVRSDSTLSDIRLIAVSGHAAATDRNRSRLSDFDAHMVKPVDPAKLFALIERESPASREPLHS